MTFFLLTFLALSCLVFFLLFYSFLSFLVLSLFCLFFSFLFHYLVFFSVFFLSNGLASVMRMRSNRCYVQYIRVVLGGKRYSRFFQARVVRRMDQYEPRTS